MATVGGLVVFLTLNSVGLRTGLATAGAELKSFQAATTAGTIGAAGAQEKDFKLITRGATVAALAILGIGAASVKAATTFEFEMKLLRVQAGASTKEVKEMSAAILEIAAEAQFGPAALARGLFHIESVGLRGAEALELLKIASQGARVGNADLESVTNALVATIMSGIGGVTSFSEAMGVLNGIVGTGNLRMEQLAKAFSSGTLSTAKQFGITIQNLGAALATLADQGIPPQEAMTRLRISITLLGAPTAIAVDQLNKIGLTERALADEMRSPRGLIGAIRLLDAHMKAANLDIVEQSILLKTAFGGARSSSGILTLINSMDLADEKLEVINAKMMSFAADFAAQQKTAAAHFNTFSAQMGVIAVRIGNALLPLVLAMTDIIVFLTRNTELVAAGFVILSLVIGVTLARALLGATSGVLGLIGSFIKSGIAATSWGRSLLGVAGIATTVSTATVGALGGVATASGVAAGHVAAASTSVVASTMTYNSAMARMVAAGVNTATMAGLSNEAIATATARMAGVVATHSVSAANSLALVGNQALIVTTKTAPGMLLLGSGVQTAMLQITAGVEPAIVAMTRFNLTFAAAAKLGIPQLIELMAIEIRATMFGLSADVARAATLLNISFAEIRLGIDALLSGHVSGRQTRGTRGAGGQGFGPLMTEAQMAAKVIAQASAASAASVEAMSTRMSASLNAMIVQYKVWATSTSASTSIVVVALDSVAVAAGIAAASMGVGFAGVNTVPLLNAGNAANVAAGGYRQLAIAAGTVPAPMLLLAATAGSVQIAATGLGLGLTGLGGIMVGVSQTATTLPPKLLLTAGSIKTVGTAAAISTPSLAGFGLALKGIGLSVIGLPGAALGSIRGGLAAIGGVSGIAAAGMNIFRLATLGVVGALSLLMLPITIFIAGWIFIGATVDKVSMAVIGFVALAVRGMAILMEAASRLPFVGDAFGNIARHLNTIVVGMIAEYDRLTEKIKSDELAGAASDVALKGMNAYLDGLEDVDARPLGQQLIDDWGIAADAVRAAAFSAGADAMSEYAKAINDGRDQVISAYQGLLDAQANSLDPAQEISRNLGLLMSDALAEGIEDGDPVIVAKAFAAQKRAVERLDLITQGAYSAGQEGVRSYDQGIQDAISQIDPLDSLLLRGEELEKWKEKFFATRGGENEPFTFGLTPEHTQEVKDTIDMHNALVKSWESLDPGARAALLAFDEYAFRAGLAGESSISMAQKVAVLTQEIQGLGDISLFDYHGAGLDIATELLTGVADGIEAQRSSVRSGMEQLTKMMSVEAIPSARQAAFLVAQLWGDTLKDAINSTDTGMQAKGFAERAKLLDLIEAVTPNQLGNLGQAELIVLGDIGDKAAQSRILIEKLGLPIDMAQGLLDYQTWLDSVAIKADNAGRSLADMASDAKGALTSAFDAIKQKADDYFRAIHEGNIQAIQDARDQKNAFLDLKLAREQRPIDKAQAALDHRRAEQQEFQLRQAVQRATDPESRLQAVFALRNFLDQRHIDEMQSETDKNATRIGRQRDRNNELFDDQVDHENKRFSLQKRSFDRQLNALERFLKSHPEMWASSQEKVLRLLSRFGGDFEDVGTRLGRKFKRAINRQLAKVVENMKTLFESTPKDEVGPDSRGFDFFGLFRDFQTGTLRVPSDQLAFLHRDEMVVPAIDAAKIRRLAGRPEGDAPLFSPTVLPDIGVRTDPGGDAARDKKGGTIIFQIGSEKIAELTDRSLYVQETIYARQGGHEMPPSRSVR